MSLRSWSELTEAWDKVQSGLIDPGLNLDQTDCDIVGLTTQSFKIAQKEYVERCGLVSRIMEFYSDNLIKHVSTEPEIKHREEFRRMKSEDIDYDEST